MNLVDYSDEEFSQGTLQQRIRNPSILVTLNPDVDISHLQKQSEETRALALSKHYDFNADSKMNHLTGHVEVYHTNHQTFSEQFHRYRTFGYAADPDERQRKLVANFRKQETLADALKAGLEVDAEDDTYNQNATLGISVAEKKFQQEIKALRHKFGDPATGDYLGPWADYDGENFQNPELTQEQRDMLNSLEERRKLKVEELKKQEKNFQPYMEQHVKQDPDKVGKPFTAPPSDLKYSDHTCYIPKRCIHTYHGHTKGVQVIRFFPRYGHLLFSGGMDNKVKLWDVQGNRECLRTYVGHTQAIKDLCFSNDGKNFLTAAYDKTVLYWDTEYGKVAQTFKIKHFPFCVKINPDASRQNLFLLGSSNKKIGQYDLNTGHRVQQYDEHLSAVNTITFFNQNRKFVSSSDDKKLFVWEFGIPVVIKHISEPEMHAVNSSALHPGQMHWAGQQSDNQIVIYDTKNGNFRMNRKKKFKGHVSAGYACQLTFSPDGQFLASGDSEGRVFFWDWKTCKNYRTIQAHDSVVISVDWHPIEASSFATASWDGTIKLWH